MEEYPRVELQRLLKEHPSCVRHADDEMLPEQNIMKDTVPQRLRRWLKLVDN